MIGKVCLPLLIFRNVAKLDLSAVEWGVVGCAALSNMQLPAGVCVGYFTRPPKGQAKSRSCFPTGHFTLFAPAPTIWQWVWPLSSLSIPLRLPPSTSVPCLCCCGHTGYHHRNSILRDAPRPQGLAGKLRLLTPEVTILLRS